MNYQETLQYLFSQLPMYQRIGAAAYKEDLHNTIELCKVLNNPENKFITLNGVMTQYTYKEVMEHNKDLKVIDKCIEEGVFTDWFLFAPHALRIVPPLNISDEEILLGCSKIIQALDNWKV